MLTFEINTLKADNDQAKNCPKEREPQFKYPSPKTACVSLHGAM